MVGHPAAQRGLLGAPQHLARLQVSVPTAYKYLQRALRLGAVERRDRHIYPSW